MTAGAGLDQFNELHRPAVLRLLLDICQSPSWRAQVADKRPYADVATALKVSDESLASISEFEIDESMIDHPRIGARKAGPRSTREQSRFADTIDDSTFEEFTRLNQQYEDKFGFIFLIAAEGKSAQEVLGALAERLAHDPVQERAVMREELAKINRQRLEQLLDNEIPSSSSH